MTILYMIKEGSQMSGFCLFNKQRLGQQVSYLEKKISTSQKVTKIVSRSQIQMQKQYPTETVYKNKQGGKLNYIKYRTYIKQNTKQTLKRGRSTLYCHKRCSRH